MKLTHTQKVALGMLANRHRPRQVTIDALIARQLCNGPRYKPTINDAGLHVVRHGALPPGHVV